MTLLRGNRYRTVRSLARDLRVSRIHVYRCLASIREVGIQVDERQVRERPTGPLARAFRVAL